MAPEIRAQLAVSSARRRRPAAPCRRDRQLGADFRRHPAAPAARAEQL